MSTPPAACYGYWLLSSGPPTTNKRKAEGYGLSAVAWSTPSAKNKSALHP